MKAKRLFVSSVLALLLASCGNQPAQSSSPSSSSPIPSSSDSPSSQSSAAPQPIVLEGVTFKEREMTAYLHSPEKTKKVTAYFREDGLKNIPYLKLSDYYQCHLGMPLADLQCGQGIITATSAAGGTAVFNTVNDTLYSKDLERFINTTIFRQKGATNTYYDGAPFLRFHSSSVDVATTPKRIDFKGEYNINLFALEGDLLLPIALAANLFQGPTMLTCFYTQENLYFVDPNNLAYETSAVIMNPDFQQALGSFFENGKRSQEQASYSYNELCFFIDNYFGRPGRETLHAALLQYGSLDAALQAQDDVTRQAREWLQSTDQVEYYAGVTVLDDYLHDTGHTYVYYGTMIYLNDHPELSAAVDEKIASIGYTFRQNAARREAQSNPKYDAAFVAARTEKGIENRGILIEDDTLLYTFDSFMYDQAGWLDYLRGKRDTYPEDPIGDFKRIQEQYKDGNTIKNIVIDLSRNGGGSGDVVFMLMAMMGKGAYLNFYDAINENHVHADYDADLNFDGVFDEKDDEVTYPYRYAILASGISFSCGNLLPVQAKESGIMLLGDTTGGGACAVIDGVLAEGYYARLGCQVRLVTAKHEEVDFGIEPDMTLLHRNGDDIDLSDFFDLSLIAGLMDEYYQE